MYLVSMFVRNNFSLQRKEQWDQSGPAVFFDYGIAALDDRKATGGKTTCR